MLGSGCRFWRRDTGRFPATATIRAHAALTALAFMVAGWLGLVHEATTTHVRCAEHGELIHDESTREDTGPSRDDTVGEASGGAPRGHEHCSLTSAMRESRMMPRPPTMVPAKIAIDDLGGAPSVAASARATSLYRTAPKTSPPA